MASAGYREVKILREDNGVCALITERVDTGHISFSLFKEFSVGNETKRSKFFGGRHIATLRKLLNKVADEIEVIEDYSRAEHRT